MTLRRSPAFTLLERGVSAACNHALGRAPPRRWPVLDQGAFHDAFAAALPQVPGLRLAHYVQVPVDRAPWFDSGIDIEPGEWLSWFSNGETLVSAALDLRLGADFQLWARIGSDGAVFRATRNSHTWRAERGGRLYFASLFPGAWATPQGELLTKPADYRGTRGQLALWLMRWREEPAAGLRALRRACDPAGLVSAEIDRHAEPPRLPADWTQLWAIGDSEIWRGAGDCIACRTRADVGIVQRPAELALAPGTRLEWEWRIDALPSRFAENTLPTHDYMSIAVEFDNGIDITYYWSARLPPGFGYWCPLPTWREREFHVVIRSGAPLAGEWLRESRDLHADYQHYIGTPPARIVRVWLIAVSLFQRQCGSCDWRAMQLVQGERRVVL